MNKLSKEKTFDYDSKELLGVMRLTSGVQEI